MFNFYQIQLIIHYYNIKASSFISVSRLALSINDKLYAFNKVPVHKHVPLGMFA